MDYARALYKDKGATPTTPQGVTTPTRDDPWRVLGARIRSQAG